MYKAKRVRTSKKARKAPRYSRVPRQLTGRVNNELVHKHTVSVNVGAAGSGFTGGLRIYQVAGVSQFQNAATGANGEQLSAMFSLNGVEIKLNGTTTCIAKNSQASYLLELYDTWTLDLVEVMMNTSMTTVDATYSNTAIPMLGWATDNNDANATSYDELSRYSTFKSQSLKYPIKHTLIPACSAQLYSASLTTPVCFARRFKEQLDTNYPITPHYGWKCALNGMYGGLATGDVCGVDLVFKLHFTMRATK